MKTGKKDKNGLKYGDIGIWNYDEYWDEKLKKNVRKMTRKSDSVSVEKWNETAENGEEKFCKNLPKTEKSVKNCEIELQKGPKKSFQGTTNNWS